MSNSIANKITRRIRAKKRGWVFTPKDFLDLGTRSNIDFVLHKLVSKKTIRRIDRGIYDFPVKHSKLGLLSPSIDNILRAITVQTGEVIQPSGANSANWLGLSTQVPTQHVYLTSGKSRKKKVGKQIVYLHHTSIAPIKHKPDKASLVLQALLYLGKQHIDNQVVKSCTKQLSSQEKNKLKHMAAQVPSWLTPIIHNIAI
jgi:hypothetical protein